MKVCIVSSCGGHLTEVRSLMCAYERYDHFYVLNHPAQLPPDMVGKTFFITHSERDPKFFLNILEAFQILRVGRPDVILSTGAGPAVPFALVGRFFFNAKIVFIETLTRIERPSLTGRIMYWLSHEFFYQWETLRPYYPGGRYAGPII